MRQRALVIRQDAELRASLLTQFGGMVDRVAEVVAARMGPVPTTLSVRDVAGAFVYVIISITLSASGEPLVGLIKQSDEALAHLEASLPLPAVDCDGERPDGMQFSHRAGLWLEETMSGAGQPPTVVSQVVDEAGGVPLYQAAEQLHSAFKDLALACAALMPDRLL